MYVVDGALVTLAGYVSSVMWPIA